MLVTFPCNIAWLWCCNGCLCLVSTLHSLPLSFLSVSFPSCYGQIPGGPNHPANYFHWKDCQYNLLLLIFHYHKTSHFCAGVKKCLCLHLWIDTEIWRLSNCDYKISSLIERCLNLKKNCFVGKQKYAKQNFKYTNSTVRSFPSSFVWFSNKTAAPWFLTILHSSNSHYKKVK